MGPGKLTLQFLESFPLVDLNIIYKAEKLDKVVLFVAGKTFDQHHTLTNVCAPIQAASL